MTPEQKVSLVRVVKDKHGLNSALAAVGLEVDLVLPPERQGGL
jgi:hypothetical protein